MTKKSNRGAKKHCLLLNTPVGAFSAWAVETSRLQPWLLYESIAKQLGIYHNEKFQEKGQTLNGDAFFPIKLWPEEMRMAFWRKPIDDKDTFKLVLFCIGNGCSPNLISKWILLAQNWAPEKAETRARQVDFVLNNADKKRSSWFYYDLDHRKLLYLSGLPKQ